MTKPEVSPDQVQEDLEVKKRLIDKLKKIWSLREDHDPAIYILRDKKYPELSWKIIAMDSDKDGDIDWFFRNDETLEILGRPPQAINNKYYLDACDLAWFSETTYWNEKKWKFEWGKQMMYRNSDPKKEAIPQASIDLYLAWEQIAFYMMRMLSNDWVTLAEKWKDNLLDKETLNLYLKTDSLRLDDLLLLKEKWWVTPTLYNYALPKVVKLLPEHCADIRFDRALQEWYLRIHWNLMEEHINKFPDDIVDKKTKELCIKIIQSRSDYAERREMEDFATKKKLERERKKMENK